MSKKEGESGHTPEEIVQPIEQTERKIEVLENVTPQPDAAEMHQQARQSIKEAYLRESPKDAVTLSAKLKISPVERREIAMEAFLELLRRGKDVNAQDLAKNQKFEKAGSFTAFVTPEAKEAGLVGIKTALRELRFNTVYAMIRNCELSKEQLTTSEMQDAAKKSMPEFLKKGSGASIFNELVRLFDIPDEFSRSTEVITAARIGAKIAAARAGSEHFVVQYEMQFGISRNDALDEE